MIVFQIFFYLVSFLILWYCSGVIIRSVDNFAHRLKLSSFAVSFFILGILTSVPEFSVGINSIINKTPDVFVGNLLGASLVLFVFVIPLLAVFGKGVKMVHQLTEQDMIFALFAVAAPIFLIADNVLTRTESIFLILIYIILFYFIEKKKGLLEVNKEKNHLKEKHMIEESLELILAIIITYFKVSSFMISVVFLSLGTNIPEISLAVRSILTGKKEVALGDYLGSAAANTLFFGIFTLLNGARINVSSYSLRTLIITLFGLGLFYLFSQSKQEISQKEGKVLLLVYLLFIGSQILFP